MANGATVGSAIVKLEFDGSEVKASLQKVSNEIEKTGSSGGSKWANAWSVAAGNLIAKGVSKITSMITGSLDRGIKRVDTLKNAGRVFDIMGYSADSVSASLKTMDGYLDGLPTSMDSAVQGIQSLAASFGGMEKGTAAFMAINDVALAFSSEGAVAAERAILQLSQTNLDGPLDAQTWNSLRQNGFTPVFDAMAKEAGISVSALKEQFGKGERTVNDFLNALIKMDTSGTSSMGALKDAARANTDGIGTALENVQNRLGKAWEKILNHINSGGSKISDVINGISSRFTDFADIVIGIMDFIAGHWNVIAPILTAVGGFVAVVISINKALQAYKAIQSAVNVVQAAFNVILNANPIMLIVTAIAALVTGLVLFFTKTEVGKKILEGFFAFLRASFGWIVTIAKLVGKVFSEVINVIVKFWSAVASIIGAWAQYVWNTTIGPIVEFVKNAVVLVTAILANVGQWVWENVLYPIISFVTTAVGTIMGIIQNVRQTVYNIIGTVVGWIYNTIIQPITSFFVGLFENIVGGITSFVQSAMNIIGSIVGWVDSSVVQPIAGFFSGLWNGITSGVRAVVDGIKNVMGTIAGVIKAPINGIISAINGVIDGINSIKVPDWVPGIGGASANFPHVPYLAQGGYAAGATGAVIGEAGKEVVLPLEQNTDNWAGLLAGTLAEQFEKEDSYAGREIVMNNTFEINNEMDANDIGRVLMQSIRRSA